MTFSKIVDLAYSENNILVPDYLESDLSNTIGALILTQIYTNLTLQQPNFEVEIGNDYAVLTQLRQHQIVAKRHSKQFLNTLEPEVIRGVTDILAYGSMFKGFKQPLLDSVAKIGEVSAAKDKALTLVSALQNQAKAHQAKARSTNAAIQSFFVQVQSDENNFSADLAEANKMLGAEKGALKEILAEISGIQTEIDGAIAGAAVSALAMIGGTVMIIIGGVATLPSGGASVAIVLSGVGIVTTGIVGVTGFATKITSANKKLQSLYQRASETNYSLVLVQSLRGQVKSLFNATVEMNSATNLLNSEWDSINLGLDKLQALIEKADDQADINYLVNTIEQAGIQWEKISTEAEQLMKKLISLTPKQVENVITHSSKEEKLEVAA